MPRWRRVAPVAGSMRKDEAGRGSRAGRRRDGGTMMALSRVRSGPLFGIGDWRLEIGDCKFEISNLQSPIFNSAFDAATAHAAPGVGATATRAAMPIRSMAPATW